MRIYKYIVYSFFEGGQVIVRLQKDDLEPDLAFFQLRYSDDSHKQGFYLFFGRGKGLDTVKGQKYIGHLKRIGYERDLINNADFAEDFDLLQQRLKDLGFNDRDYLLQKKSNGEVLPYGVFFNDSQKDRGLLDKFILNALENTELSRMDYAVLQKRGAVDGVVFRVMIDDKARDEFLAKIRGNSAGNKEILFFMKKPGIAKEFLNAKARLEKEDISYKYYKNAGRNILQLWGMINGQKFNQGCS